MQSHCILPYLCTAQDSLKTCASHECSPVEEEGRGKQNAFVHMPKVIVCKCYIYIIRANIYVVLHSQMLFLPLSFFIC